MTKVVSIDDEFFNEILIPTPHKQVYSKIVESNANSLRNAATVALDDILDGQEVDMVLATTPITAIVTPIKNRPGILMENTPLSDCRGTETRRRTRNWFDLPPPAPSNQVRTPSKANVPSAFHSITSAAKERQGISPDPALPPTTNSISRSQILLDALTNLIDQDGSTPSPGTGPYQQVQRKSKCQEHKKNRLSNESQWGEDESNIVPVRLFNLSLDASPQHSPQSQSGPLSVGFQVAGTGLRRSIEMPSTFSKAPSLKKNRSEVFLLGHSTVSTDKGREGSIKISPTQYPPEPNQLVTSSASDSVFATTIEISLPSVLLSPSALAPSAAAVLPVAFNGANEATSSSIIFSKKIDEGVSFESFLAPTQEINQIREVDVASGQESSLDLFSPSSPEDIILQLPFSQNIDLFHATPESKSDLSKKESAAAPHCRPIPRNMASKNTVAVAATTSPLVSTIQPTLIQQSQKRVHFAKFHSIDTQDAASFLVKLSSPTPSGALPPTLPMSPITCVTPQFAPNARVTAAPLSVVGIGAQAQQASSFSSLELDSSFFTSSVSRSILQDAAHAGTAVTAAIVKRMSPVASGNKAIPFAPTTVALTPAARQANLTIYKKRQCFSTTVAEASSIRRSVSTTPLAAAWTCSGSGGTGTEQSSEAGCLVEEASKKQRDGMQAIPSRHKDLQSNLFLTPKQQDADTFCFASKMLVWAKWRPHLYCPTILQERTSRTRQLWQVKYIHWRDGSRRRTFPILSSDDLLPFKAGLLHPGDPLFLVINRRKALFEPVTFVHWDQQLGDKIQVHPSNYSQGQVTSAALDREGCDLIVDLSRVVMDKRLFLSKKISFTKSGLYFYSSPFFGSASASQMPSRDVSNDNLAANTSAAVVVSQKRPALGQIENKLTNCRKKGRNSPSILGGLSFWISLGGGLTETAKRIRKSHLINRIHALGGNVAPDSNHSQGNPPQGLILLSNGFYRTPKTFLALIFRIPLINIQWIDACEGAGTLLDCTSYAIPIPSPAIPSENSSPVDGFFLDGWQFTIEGNSKFKSSWIPVIQAAKGTVLNDFKHLLKHAKANVDPKLNKSTGKGDCYDKVRILMDQQPASSTTIRLVKMALEVGIGIVNIDWLMKSIILESSIYILHLRPLAEFEFAKTKVTHAGVEPAISRFVVWRLVQFGQWASLVTQVLLVYLEIKRAVKKGQRMSSGAGASLLTFLISEYLLLATEARRKDPAIKTQVDELIVILIHLKDSSTASTDVAFGNAVWRVGMLLLTFFYLELRSSSSTLLKPLQIASKSAYANKYFPNVTNILLRLVTHAAIQANVDAVQVVLDVLDCVATGGGGKLVEDLQLRTLQCIMPLLTHYQDCIHGENLFRTYGICFHLQSIYGGKSATLANATNAIIRQVVIWLFEQLSHEQANKSSPSAECQPHPVKVIRDDGVEISLNPFAADAYFVFQDICHVADGETPSCLPFQQMSTLFALELLESILSSNSNVFRNDVIFGQLIKDKLCSFAMNRLTSRIDFPHACRLWRLVRVLVVEFNDILPVEVEIFISLLLRLLDESLAPWERGLVLEMCQELFGNVILLNELYSICEAGQLGFRNVQELLEMVANQVIALSLKLATSKTYLAVSKAELKMPLLQLFEKNQPPEITEVTLCWLAYSSIHNLLEGFIKLLPIDLTTGKYSLARLGTNVNTLPPRSKLMESMLGCWSSNLRALNSLSGCRVDHEWRSSFLRTFSNLGIAAAVTGNQEAVNATLQSFSDLAIPEFTLSIGPSSSDTSVGSLVVTDMNLDASASILRLALIIDEYLGPAWIHIIRVIHSNDQFAVVKAKKAPSAQPDNVSPSVGGKRGSAGPTLATVATTSFTSLNDFDAISDLTDLARRVVENSAHLSLASFNHYLHALCLLSSETFQLLRPVSQDQSPSANQNSSSAVMQVKTSLVLFPIQKIKQVLLMNVFRFTLPSESLVPDEEVIIDEAWSEAIRQLSAVTNFDDSGIRGLGSEIISLLCSQFNNSVAGASQSFSGDSTLQTRLLSMLELFMREGKCGDVQKTVLESLNKLIQSLGPYFNKDGWSIILNTISSAISSVIDGAATLLIARTAFAGCKVIAAEFLPHLQSDNLRQLVQVLILFARSKEELNISLTSIGLVWDVADHVRHLKGSQDSLQFATVATSQEQPVSGSPSGYPGDVDEVFSSGSSTAVLSNDFNLWIDILNELLSLTMESRPEIRNSAIQTVIRAVAIGGDYLSKDEWTSIFERNLLPLLSSIPRSAVTAFEAGEAYIQEAHAKSGGASAPRSPVGSPSRLQGPAKVAQSAEDISKGKSTGGLVHHSRDSIAKQWSETLVIFLQGVTEIYCRFLHNILGIPMFITNYWECIHEAVVNYVTMAYTNVELTSTAISCLLKLVSTSTGNDLARKLRIYHRSWACWCAIGATMPVDKIDYNSSFTQDSLLKFVRIYPLLLADERLFGLSLSWVERSWSILDRALLCSTGSEVPRDVDNPSELQRAILEMVDSTLFSDGQARLMTMVDNGLPLKFAYLCQLANWLKLLRPREDLKIPQNGSLRRSRMNTANSLPVSANSVRDNMKTRPAGSFVAMVTAVLDKTRSHIDIWATEPQADALFTSDAVERLLLALAFIIKLKHLAPTGSSSLAMWKLTTLCMNSVVLSVIPICPPSHVERLWDIITETFSSILDLAQNQIPDDMSMAQIREDEFFETGQVDFIRFKLLPVMNHIPFPPQDRLLMAISRCANLYKFGGRLEPLMTIHPVIKEELAIHCFTTLFLLCNDVEEEFKQLKFEDLDDEVFPPRPAKESQLQPPSSPVPVASPDPECLMTADEQSNRLEQQEIPNTRVQYGEHLKNRALGLILEKFRKVVLFYCDDKTILYKRPFPRFRRIEIRLFLRYLMSLKLAPTMDVSGVNGDLLKNGRGHLYHLYEEFCRLLQAADDDRRLGPLLHRIFAMIGSDLCAVQSVIKLLDTSPRLPVTHYYQRGEL